MRATCTSSVDIRDISDEKTRSLWLENEDIKQKPREPVMGIEPMTPVLPRLCATAAPHGQVAR